MNKKATLVFEFSFNVKNSFMGTELITNLKLQVCEFEPQTSTFYDQSSNLTPERKVKNEHTTVIIRYETSLKLMALQRRLTCFLSLNL